MGHWCPPYLNKEVKACQAQLKRAQVAERKAKANYAYAQEYVALCQQYLDEAIKNAQESEEKSGN